MGMTMTQKILAAHAGLEKVEAGQLINTSLDIVLGNDITTPVAINEFEKNGFKEVFDKDKIAKNVHKYNFAPTFSPDEFYVIKAQTRSLSYFVIIEGTDELCERLLEYSRYALLDEADSREEEDY